MPEVTLRTSRPWEEVIAHLGRIFSDPRDIGGPKLPPLETAK